MKCLSNKNNVQALKILITAEFSNVTLELEVVDVANANQEFPKHLPILVLDDGTQLFSSTQSCLYLFKDKLLNTSAVNQWLEWEAVKLLPNVLAFIDNPKQLSERLKSVLDVLNKSLQSTSFLVGESISVADISLWTTLHPALSDDKVKPMFANYTHVGSWYDNISKLTQVQKALKSWTDVLKGSTDTSLSEAFSSLSIVSNPSDNTVLSSLNKLATCSKKCNKPSQAESTAAVLEDDLSSKSKDVTTQEIEEAKAAWSGETPAPLRPRTVPVLPLPNENNILITSALPYVNNVPHLGNIIGCVLSADVFSRFCRLVNRNALYVSGTDEYGTATETKALEEGLTPRQICDKYFAIHDEVYKWFDIDFDYFGRTSTPEQTKIVQQVFSDVHKAEFTSTASVEQLHCGQCDRFLADRFVEGVCPKCRYEDARGDQCDGCGGLINAIELVQPRCKQCGQAPTIRSSTQLFLELPKIEENLQSWVSATSDQWSSNARVICKAWLKEGLKPRCITRDLKWGIPVPLPGFENKVFYVWFDAPIGYMSLTQSYCGQYEAWWKSTPNKNITLYQFMAKDNVPFHSIMFPATLVAAGDNYTKVNHIMATEYLNYEDGKFSKSRGTGVFGNNAKDTGLPADIFRFYLLYVRPENQDTSFSWQDLATKNNSELLNNLGNFINRALSFIDKNYGSTIPPMSLGHDDYLLLALINRETSAYYAGLDKAKLRDGIRYILNISRYSNQYMQANQPWVLYKGTDEQKSRASTVLGVLCQVAYLLSLLLSPYMPHTAATISEQLGANQLKYSLTDKPRLLCYLPPGHKIGTPAPLFRKIEQAQVDEWKVKYGGQQSKGPQSDKKTVATGQTGFKSAEECEKAVTDQGNLVRQMKSGGTSKAELAPHVERLLALKKQLELLKSKGGASEVSNGSSGGETEFKSVEECEKAVADQGNLVRQMKSGGTSKAELAPHVERLLALKKQLELLKSKGGASEVSNGNTGDTKALEEEITKQAEIVRKLKASAGGDKSVFAADLAKLLSLKQQLATLMGTSAPSPAPSGSKKNKNK